MLRKLALGHRLLFRLGRYELHAPNLSAAFAKVRAKWVERLISLKYLVRGLAGALVLTKVGRQAAI